MSDNKTVTFYDGMAENYDEIVKQAKYSVAANIYSWIQPHLRIEQGKLLDLGIGTGLASIHFARNGWDVTGVDASEKMLRQVRRKCSRIRLIQADLSNGRLPIGLAHFDAVLCIGLLEFIVNVKAFIRSVADVAKSGACLVLAIRDYELNPQFTCMQHQGQNIDRSAYEQYQVLAVHHAWYEVRNELTSNGFNIREEKTVLAYRSPTQGFETMNRVVFARFVAG